MCHVSLFKLFSFMTSARRKYALLLINTTNRELQLSPLNWKLFLIEQAVDWPLCYWRPPFEDPLGSFWLFFAVTALKVFYQDSWVMCMCRLLMPIYFFQKRQQRPFNEQPPLIIALHGAVVQIICEGRLSLSSLFRWGITLCPSLSVSVQL